MDTIKLEDLQGCPDKMDNAQEEIDECLNGLLNQKMSMV